MWNVSVVMFAPNLISWPIRALRNSAHRSMRAATISSLRWLVTNAPPSLAFDVGVVAGHRVDHLARYLGSAGTVEERQRDAVDLESEGGKLLAEDGGVEIGHGWFSPNSFGR